jgi:transcription antitermination factor NusG
VQLNSVRFCPGVLGPVAFGGELAVVDQGLIDALRHREGERGYALPVEQEEGISRGSTVRVMFGPLEGIKGVFRGYLRGRERAKVLMDFLRNRHEVEVDTAALAVVRA